MLLDVFSSMDFYYRDFVSASFVFLPWGFVFIVVSFLCLSFYCVVYKNIFLNIFFLKGWLKNLNRYYMLKIFISCCFVVLLVGNFLGLFPYVFSATRHIFFNLCFSFLLWFMIVLRSFIFDPLGYLGHHTPLGSPLVLSFFLAIVEGIRNFIRFITLALRLRVNIRTGHIFIFLLRRGLIRSRLGRFFGLYGLGLYIVFEFAICFVQAFVFRLLLLQYIKES